MSLAPKHTRIIAVPTLSFKLEYAFSVSCLLWAPLVGCERSHSAPTAVQVQTAAQIQVPTHVQPLAQAQVRGPTIDFDSRVHDFGTVNEGTALKHVFTVKNTGTSPLVLSGVTTSCGCTAATLGVDQIPAGGSGPIEVTFDTHAFGGMGSKTITVSSNDQRSPTSTLEIKYNIERLLALERVFVRLTAERGTAHVERVWLTGKLVEQAKPRVAKVEGGDKQVLVKTIEDRQDGKLRKGLEIKLKGNKPVSGYGDITIKTGLPNPAELTLRFNCSVS